MTLFDAILNIPQFATLTLSPFGEVTTLQYRVPRTNDAVRRVLDHHDAPTTQFVTSTTPDQMTIIRATPWIGDSVAHAAALYPAYCAAICATRASVDSAMSVRPSLRLSPDGIYHDYVVRIPRTHALIATLLDRYAVDTHRYDVHHAVRTDRSGDSHHELVFTIRALTPTPL